MLPNTDTSVYITAFLTYNKVITNNGFSAVLGIGQDTVGLNPAQVVIIS